jgi:hypothetical protein
MTPMKGFSSKDQSKPKNNKFPLALPLETENRYGPETREAIFI